MAEPEKFFVGIIDFFAVLLPGGVFAYCLRYELHTVNSSLAILPGTEGWAVFLVASYLLGHFIFLLGSPLDDWLYNPIRKATYDAQLKQLAGGEDLSGSFSRFMANRFFKKGSDRAVNKAVALRNQYLKPLEASTAVNAFQWSKARLALEHPQTLADVQSFEAHSKFFRSLVVVLFLVILGALVTALPSVDNKLGHMLGSTASSAPDLKKHLAVAILCAVLLVLAFWRYVDQRAKATNQSYWYVITMEGQRNQAPQKLLSTHFTHAGGVVFRNNNSQVQYLLVQAKLNPDEWVLPKGKIETEEPIRETAVREVQEETGVWARIKSELNGITLTVKGEPVKVQFYLMEYLEKGDPDEEDEVRKHGWFALPQALEKVTHPESRELIRQAELKRRLLGLGGDIR